MPRRFLCICFDDEAPGLEQAAIQHARAKRQQEEDDAPERERAVIQHARAKRQRKEGEPDQHDQTQPLQPVQLTRVPLPRYEGLTEVVAMSLDPRYHGHVAELIVRLMIVGDNQFEVHDLQRVAGSNGHSGQEPLCRICAVENESDCVNCSGSCLHRPATEPES